MALCSLRFASAHFVLCPRWAIKIAKLGVISSYPTFGNCCEALFHLLLFNAMQCNAMLCAAMQCNAMRCNAMQCNAMQCNAMRCNAMRCDAMQCDAMQCNAMRCNAMQCNAMMNGNLQPTGRSEFHLFLMYAFACLRHMTPVTSLGSLHFCCRWRSLT